MLFQEPYAVRRFRIQPTEQLNAQTLQNSIQWQHLPVMKVTRYLRQFLKRVNQPGHGVAPVLPVT